MNGSFLHALLRFRFLIRTAGIACAFFVANTVAAPILVPDLTLSSADFTVQDFSWRLAGLILEARPKQKNHPIENLTLVKAPLKNTQTLEKLCHEVTGTEPLFEKGRYLAQVRPGKIPYCAIRDQKGRVDQFLFKSAEQDVYALTVHYRQKTPTDFGAEILKKTQWK